MGEDGGILRQAAGEFLGVTGLEHGIGGEVEMRSLLSYCGVPLLVGRGREEIE